MQGIPVDLCFHPIKVRIFFMAYAENASGEIHRSGSFQRREQGTGKIKSLNPVANLKLIVFLHSLFYR